MTFCKLREYNEEIFFFKNYTKNVKEKLVSDSFIKNKN